MKTRKEKITCLTCNTKFKVDSPIPLKGKLRTNPAHDMVQADLVNNITCPNCGHVSRALSRVRITAKWFKWRFSPWRSPYPHDVLAPRAVGLQVQKPPQTIEVVPQPHRSQQEHGTQHQRRNPTPSLERQYRPYSEPQAKEDCDGDQESVESDHGSLELRIKN